jgi:hypothetical protein
VHSCTRFSQWCKPIFGTGNLWITVSAAARLSGLPLYSPPLHSVPAARPPQNRPEFLPRPLCYDGRIRPLHLSASAGGGMAWKTWPATFREPDSP